MNFLKNRKENRNEDSTIYDRIKTSRQAEECADLDKKPKDRDPEWRACKLIGEYLKVREAFEQDKAAGFKGCANQKPGEVCMGHATKALIDSDYFPW